MLEQLIEWICVDDSGLGMPVLSGAPSTRQLGYPMILLNVLTEFCGNDAKMREKYSKQFKWSTEAILKHVITTSYLDRLLLLLIVLQYDGDWVHEYALKSGGFPDGCLGRMTIPGHVIEAGWFLLHEAINKLV